MKNKEEKCSYWAGRTEICPGAYPEGCFLENDIQKRAKEAYEKTNHHKMYSRFKESIWYLRQRAAEWWGEEISESLFRQNVGEELLKAESSGLQKAIDILEERKRLEQFSEGPFRPDRADALSEAIEQLKKEL